MGEASRLIHVFALPDVTPDAGDMAALKAALDSVEDDYLARVMLRRERLAELVAPVPSEEAMRRTGGER